MRTRFYSRHWTTSLMYSTIVYAVCMATRLLEVPRWLQSSIMADGGPIMSTHDSYAWLAGAEGINNYAGSPLAELASWLHSLFGISYTSLGFYLPAFLAPFAGIPVVILMVRWGKGLWALPAGIVSAMSMGFLVRSRVGSYDTDLYTLFLGVTTVVGIVLILSRYCRNSWKKGQEEVSRQTDTRLWVESGIMALFLYFYRVAYFSGQPIALGTLVIGTACAFILGGTNRNRLFASLGIMASGYVIGPWALLIAAVCWYAENKRPEFWSRFRLFLLPAAVFVIAYFVFGGAMSKQIIKSVLFYFAKEGASQTVGSGVILPDVMKSVIEAGNTSYSETLELLSGNVVLSIVLLAGYAWACAVQPLALLFLPILVLGLSSPWAGMRFVMYGAPVIGVGCYGVADAVQKFCRNLRMPDGKALKVTSALSLVFAGLLLWKPIDIERNIPAMPILSRTPIEAFVQLKDRVPENAMLWQWWDYGYAAQFYAQRGTFGDGGRHGGKYLYPLGLAFSSQSPLQCAQAIKYFAMQGYKPGVPRPKALRPGISYITSSPTEELSAIGGKKAQAFIDSLATKRLSFPSDLPSQYITVSWELLRLSPWITYFGNWNIEKGTSRKGRFEQLVGKINVDGKKGVLRLPTGQTTRIASFTLVGAKGIKTKRYQNNSRGHIILNQFTNEVCVADGRVFNSMLVQLLLAEPAELEPYFELVENKAPWVRVWRVK